MLINLRNALMAGKRLPYDAEVEYLESTGTQYIDTGYVPNAQTRWEMTVAFKYVIGTFQCHGCIYVGTPRERFSMSLETGDKLNVSVGATDNITSILGADQVHTMTADALNNQWTIDNSTGTFDPYSSLSNLGSIYLFARHRGTGRDAYVTNGRVYCSKIYEAGVLIQDLIPVRKGTVGYLYDRVSGKLFGNAGTGDFVVGPDVVPVEWLDNGGTAYIDTGYVFKTKPRVVTNCIITSGIDKDLFGTSTVDASCFIFDLALSYPVWLYYRYGSSSALTVTGSRPRVGQKIHIDASDKVYIDDVLILTRTGTYDFSQGSTTCRIFAARSILPSRIYDLSMWDGDSLVRKYTPVRVGTDATSWEGAMMDVLTRRIYRNAGTGAFTYGNDLKYPIPAE